MTPSDPALIGLDWGTSSLRAWLFNRNGKILDARTTDEGILNLPAGGFPEALRNLTSGWGTLPTVACGMVGSRNGWREVPYLDCPANVADIAIGLDRAMGIAIVPGLRMDGAVSDVMRGEETQIVGALADRPALAANALMILPGTHGKWAKVQDGRIASFRTFMTGELFAILTRHSILGQLPAQGESDPETRADAFKLGVLIARDPNASLSAHLFSTRSLVLNGHLDVAAARDYLSGLLIGDEIRSGLELLEAHGDNSAVLIGEPALCARYASAFALLGHAAPEILGNTAADGLFHIARAAHFVEAFVQ